MKLELLVPTSTAEIPLKSYQEFMKISEDSNDDEFIAQKMIEIFCGIELKHIVQIKMTDVNRLVEKFSEMFSESYTSFLNPSASSLLITTITFFTPINEQIVRWRSV